MAQFSDNEEAAIVDVNIIVSCFSLIGALFIISAYFSFQKLRVFAFKLIVYLAVCDAMYAVGVIIGHFDDDDGLCQF